MGQEDVQSAPGTSIVEVRGQIKLPMDFGFIKEPYHNPHLPTNIISVDQMNDTYSSLLICDPPAQDDHSTCIILSWGTTNDVLSVPIEYGLNYLKPEKRV